MDHFRHTHTPPKGAILDTYSTYIPTSSIINKADCPPYGQYWYKRAMHSSDVSDYLGCRRWCMHLAPWISSSSLLLFYFSLSPLISVWTDPFYAMEKCSSFPLFMPPQLKTGSITNFLQINQNRKAEMSFVNTYSTFLLWHCKLSSGDSNFLWASFICF